MNNRLLRQAAKVTANFFARYNDIIIIQADKGNKTAIIDFKQYKEKMTNHVNKYINKGIYTKVENFSKIERAIVCAFNRLRGKLSKIYYESIRNNWEKPFDTATKIILYKKKFVIPTLYGTIKCHKENQPVRPICASSQWYSNGIQKVIVYTLNKNLGHLLCKNNVKNIDDIIPIICRIPVMNNYMWVKFDIQDMYNSMDRGDIFQFLTNVIRHEDFKRSCRMDSNLLLQLIYFSLETANYVRFGENTYAQTKGLPQGACDSGLYATIYLDYLLQLYEEMLFKQNRIVYWFKYMDDFLVYIPKDRILDFKKCFEAITSLKLDMEEESMKDTYSEISFLDINIITYNGKFETSMYKKPCASLRMTNYLSSTSNSSKANIVKMFINKVLSRTCNRLLEKDLIDLENKLVENNYPRVFIKKCFRTCISKHIKQLNDGTPNIPMNKDNLKLRKNIVWRYLKRFAFCSSKLLKYILNNMSNTNKERVGKTIVYDAVCIPFEHIIRKIHKFYKLPRVTFRAQRNLYKQVKGTTPQQVNKRMLEMNSIGKGSNEHNMGIAKCNDCDVYFILLGKDNINILLEKSINDVNSDIYKHANTYGHDVPTQIYNISNNRITDMSTNVQIHRALLKTMGISCQMIGSIENTPFYIRGLLQKLQSKIKHKNMRVGIPIIDRNIKNKPNGGICVDMQDVEVVNVVDNNVLVDNSSIANAESVIDENNSIRVNNPSIQDGDGAEGNRVRGSLTNNVLSMSENIPNVAEILRKNKHIFENLNFDKNKEIYERLCKNNVIPVKKPRTSSQISG